MFESLLHEFGKIGLTEEHFSNWQPKAGYPLFTIYHANAIRTLITEHHVSPTDAVAEISGLTQLQAEIVAELYSHGLRGIYLQKWQPKAEHSLFLKGHTNAIRMLITQRHISPANAVAEINGLLAVEAEIVAELYTYGLRGIHLQKWQPKKGYSLFLKGHADAIRTLITQHHVSAANAVTEIRGLSNLEAVNKANTYKNRHRALKEGFTGSEQSFFRPSSIRDAKPISCKPPQL